MTTERRVFLAPFSNPTAGRWVPADEAEEELERLQDIWGDVDFGAMDSEGFGGTVCEMTSIADIIEADRLIEIHGDAFFAFLKIEGIEHATAARFEDAYVGEYASDREFAEELVDSCGYLDEVPENLRFYFNYDAFARDLMMDHYSEDGFYFRA